MRKRGRCPAQAGKRQSLRFSLFLDFACAFVVPLFPEPGSIDFTLGALHQSGLEGLAELWLFAVVEDDSYGVPMAGTQAAHSMT